MMKPQASPHDHSIKKTTHFHDHKVCETLATVYCMPVDLQLEVPSTQLEPHQERFQGCQDHHFCFCLESHVQLQKKITN